MNVKEWSEEISEKKYRIEKWVLVDLDGGEINMTLTEAKRLLAHYEMMWDATTRYEIVLVDEE